MLMGETGMLFRGWAAALLHLSEKSRDDYAPVKGDEFCIFLFPATLQFLAGKEVYCWLFGRKSDPSDPQLRVNRFFVRYFYSHGLFVVLACKLKNGAVLGYFYDRFTNNYEMNRMNQNESWQEKASFYKPGMQRTACVSKILSYGCMLELEEGLQAFMHRIDMDWMSRSVTVDEWLACGDRVEVRVLEVNCEKELIHVGMKQCTENPWKGSKARYPVGSRVKGVVTELVDYGCFLRVDERLEAFLAVSDLHWLDKNCHPSKWLSVGDCLEVMVLDVQEERYRMSVGWKHCQPNPWEQFAQKYQEKDVLSGRVKEVNALVIFVDLDFGVSGILFQADGPAALDLQQGDDLRVRLLSIDSERERIILEFVAVED